MLAKENTANTMQHGEQQPMNVPGTIHYERSGRGEPLWLLLLLLQHGIGSRLRVGEPSGSLRGADTALLPYCPG